jgi:hypothetical protein
METPSLLAFPREPDQEEDRRRLKHYQAGKPYRREAVSSAPK